MAGVGIFFYDRRPQLPKADKAPGNWAPQTRTVIQKSALCWLQLFPVAVSVDCCSPPLLLRTDFGTGLVAFHEHVSTYNIEITP